MTAIFLALLLVAATAAGAETPWYAGQPVVMVSLEAADGGLPGENLEPLLNLKQGDALELHRVRADLTVLHQVGQFAAVEAHVEPWVGYDDEGFPFQAVRLVYLVSPPPRLRRIRAKAAGPLSRREVEAATGLGRGDAFYENQDVAAVQRRVTQALAKRGHPHAEVQVQAQPVDLRQLDLELRVDPGPPQLLEDITLVGMPEELERPARRTLRRNDLRQGRRYERDDVQAAHDALEELLVRRHYPEAEVKGLLLPVEEGSLDARLTYLVQAGRQVEVSVDGVGLISRRRLAQQVRGQLTHEVTPEILAEVEDLLVQDLKRRGWLTARMDLRARDDGDLRSVRVAVDRGPRHVLDQVRFEGAEAYGDRYLADAMGEASPEVLGHWPRARVTHEEVDRSLEVLREFYRSQGFLQARLEREELAAGERRRSGKVPVTVTVQVVEGPRTTLAQLRLEGQACPGAEEVLEGARELEGQPLDPSAMDALARQLAEACWDEGFLQADVQVLREVDTATDKAVVRFVATAGPSVWLRNTIVQGHEYTRRHIIEREILLHAGEPVTRSGLVETRRKLYDLQLFGRVETLLIGDEDRVKDLLVVVDEYPRIALDVGGGASTDQGVKAFMRATHRNLWGRAHRLSLVTQAGLSYSGEEWRLDTTAPEWRAGLRYEAPNIPGDEQRSFLDLLINEETQHTTFRLARSGGGVGVQTPLGRSGQLVMDYRLEWRRLEDVDSGALLEDDPWLSRLGLPDSSVEDDEPFDPTAWSDLTLPSAGRIASGPGFLLVADARDDPQNPRRGVRWMLQGRLEDGVLSDVPLVTGRTQLQTLLPLRRLGLLIGLQAGMAQVLDTATTLPLEERFRLGGAGSLRGYRRETVGPKNRLSAYDPGYPPEISPLLEYLRSSDPHRWVATGGDAMLLGTLELKVPLSVLGLSSWQDAAVVAFTDVGNAFLLNDLVETTSMQEGGEPLLRTGVGVGFRYATALGPLQLDLGINPAPIEERDESTLRFHVSLGTL